MNQYSKTITIKIENDEYTVESTDHDYSHLMSDLVVTTILAAHYKLECHELISLIELFWNKYSNVDVEAMPNGTTVDDERK